MDTNILGNPKALRKLWCGLLADLVVKLTGKNGPEYQEELAKYLRKEPCWINGDKTFETLYPLNFTRAYHSLNMDQQYADFLISNPMPSKEGLWPIPVLKGVTCNKVIEALRELGVKVWTYYDDLDANIPTNDRDPNNGSYWVSCKATIEADEELKGLSANTLKERNVKGLTLLERFLLGLAYQQHLDDKNITLCIGSRGSGGCVPLVDWNSGGHVVRVDWCRPDDGGGSLRACAAVSL